MKQEAGVKIAQLESELSRWQFDSAATEEKLRNERDYHMNEAERFRTAHISAVNECEKFRAKINDLERLLDRERRNRLKDLPIVSSSRSQHATSDTPEVITVDNDPDGDVKSIQSNLDNRTSLIDDRRRSVFVGVELKATSMLKKQTPSILQNPSKATLSKRAFEKSSADHPWIESPTKRPKVHEDRESMHVAAPRKAHTSPNSPVNTTPSRMETEAFRRPDHTITPSNPQSLVNNESGPNQLLSRSRSSSLSYLTPFLSVVKDISGGEEFNDGASQRVSPVPGSLSTSGPPRSRHPSSISAHQPSVDIRSKYLSEAPTFTISPHPSNICVSRQFLNHEFGGGEMQFTGVMDKIGGQKHHQKHHVMFPQQRQNPLMASTPGAPGLLYTGRTDLINYIWRMFGPVPGSSNPALWRHLGEYRLVHVGNLTPAEFQCLPQRVQTSLVKAISKFNWDGYSQMRARIYLRKNGRVVNDATVHTEINKSKTKAKCHYGDKLTEADILNALLTGDETITVLLMTCVGYDHDFVANFSSFKDFEHRQPPERGSKTAKKKSARRRSLSVGSDLQSVNLDGHSKAGGSGATEHQQVRPQRPQRKRTAPRRFVVDGDDSMGSDTY